MAGYGLQDPSSSSSPSFEAMIDYECLVIFLIMHTSEHHSRPASPSAVYDTMWPLQQSVPSSSSSSSSSSSLSLSPVSQFYGYGAAGGASGRGAVDSPSDFASTDRSRKFAPINAPKSPTSPKSGGRPLSPKRSHVSSPKSYKSSLQYVHMIRQRLPLILSALATEASHMDEDLLGLELGHAESPFMSSGREPGRLTASEFLISRKAIDCLGLILGGGATRDDEVWSEPSSCEY
jgi:hypothetical protein